MHKVAILLSVYNGEEYIKEQMDSLLNQKFIDDKEILIRIDGLNDKTFSKIENYLTKDNIKVFKGNNIGAARSYLWLLKNNLNYEFYVFSDQDDVWKEDKIQIGINAIKDIEKPALYCSNSEIVDENLNSVGRNTHRFTPTYNLESVLTLFSCAQGCTIIINRKLANIIQENNLPEKIVMHDSLISCLCLAADGVLIYDHNSTMKYRISGKNTLGLPTKEQFGIFSILILRLKEIFTKREVSMSDQARSLINTYGKYINDKNKKICDLVANAQSSIFCRMKLVLSKRIKCDTLNMTITRKIKMLLNNN